jgi:hypothetical protein
MRHLALMRHLCLVRPVCCALADGRAWLGTDAESSAGDHVGLPKGGGRIYIYRLNGARGLTI